MTGGLQQQIRQSKPFRSLEEEAFLNIFRTCAAFLAEFGDLLRTVALTQPQYNILRILRGAGTDGLACGEIGDRMVGRDPEVTRVLDRLEARGFVTRERSTADRRVVIARITPDGLGAVDALDAPVANMHRRQLGHLSGDDLRTLNALLERARNEGA